jgi:hypothetical protein
MKETKTTSQESNVKTPFLICITIAAISLISGFFFFELSWNEIKDYPILGIPFGIILFSYLGGLSQMIYTIYKGSKIEFFFNWVLVNSFGSILFGAAVFLFISTIVDIEIEYLLFLIVFVAAYFSNFFIVQFAISIQNTLIESSSKTTNSSILDDTTDSDKHI